MLRIDSCVTLNNGVLMPLFGLGTYKSKPGTETENAVRWAIDAGYIHIDTAQYYGNEESVGKAIRESGIDRDKLFITTKIAISNFGYQQTINSFYESLQKFQLEYIDLVLLHFPVESLRLESWKALETLYREKKARAIGISNFTIAQTAEVLSNCEVKPAVNQVEFSPFLYQKELHEYSQANQIQLESYTPLTRGRKFNHPTIQEIAQKYRKTPAQILIRWVLEHNIIVIPKSTNKDRIRENSQVFDFELSSEDMLKLDSLNENFRLAWNPENQTQLKFFSTNAVRKVSTLVSKLRGL